MQINDNRISNFREVSFAGYSVLIQKDFPKDKLPLPVEQYKDIFKPVNSSKHAIVQETNIVLDAYSCSIYVKQHLHRSLKDKLKHLVRYSRGRRALMAGAMLTENGIDSPKIIALAEKKIGPFCTENILITVGIANAKIIYAWQADWSSPQTCPVKLKRQFVMQLGETIGKMHAKNISHGDLRPGNVHAKLEDNNWHFYFLDNERTVKLSSLPMKLRVKNLVQINMLPKFPFTKTDRMRFYNAYLKENPQLKTDTKSLAKKVSQITYLRLSKKLPVEQI